MARGSGGTEAVPGHPLHLWVHMEGLVVNLVNIYAPTLGQDRLHFYQQASAFLSTLDPHECLVLGGDFNATLEKQDRSGTEQCLAAADVLREIVEHHSLVDVWCDHHSDDVSTFTFVQVEADLSRHPSWTASTCHASIFHRPTPPASGQPCFRITI
ncbi:unnamed protein product [Caretta caretta]